MVAARLIDEDLLAGAAHSSASDTADDLWSANRSALAKVLGTNQWDAVAAVYRREAAIPTGDQVQTARDALRPLVQGKRYVIPQRWRNLFSN